MIQITLKGRNDNMKKAMMLMVILVLISVLSIVPIPIINMSRVGKETGLFDLEITEDKITVCQNNHCIETKLENVKWILEDVEWIQSEDEWILGPNEWILGEIIDEKDIRHKAEIVLSSVYGKKEIKGQKPFLLFYNEQYNAWLVEGQMPFPCRIIMCFGGTAKIVIEGATGKVLAIWHEK